MARFVLWLGRFGLSFCGGLAISFLSAVASAPATGGTTDAPADYRPADSWLCRPERTDACSLSQDATMVAADGSRSIERWAPAHSAGVDCFYVYPTISNDPEGNSDMIAGPEERHIVDQQFARLGKLCRTFAPVYRQVTMAALKGSLAGRLMRVEPDRAYQDVLAAWHYYLRHDNHGRGFVLIGHSQGARMLNRLLSEEIDGKPIQRQLVSALLVGSNVLVPEGKDVGGDFKTIPLCRSSDQAGCVIAYESFRASAPPPAGSRFAYANAPGMTVACVNPAELSGDSGILRSYFPVGTGIFPDMAAWQPVRGGAPIATRFAAVPGLVRAHCSSDTHGSYLAVSVAADPGDPRADDIPGDILVNGGPLKDWGLHPADINLAMGNLEKVLNRQIVTYLLSSAPPRTLTASKAP